MNINLAIKQGSKIFKDAFIRYQLDSEILMSKQLKDVKYVLLNSKYFLNR